MAARRETVATLLLYRQAYSRRKRREEIHLLGLRNEVRSFMGADPIENPYGDATQPGTDKDEAARKALLRQMDLDGEEMAPEDLQAIQ